LASPRATLWLTLPPLNAIEQGVHVIANGSRNIIHLLQGKLPNQDLEIYTLEIKAISNGRVQKIDGGIISDIVRQCGAPALKLAGVDFKKYPEISWFKMSLYN
jgi:hypothetical protein